MNLCFVSCFLYFPSRDNRLLNETALEVLSRRKTFSHNSRKREEIIMSNE